MEFVAFPKIARLSRDIIITEKLDGTNASIYIEGGVTDINPEHVIWTDGIYRMAVGSRTRWLRLDDDNYGFANWAHSHAKELAELGPGHHFGEWWGGGIQRGYGLDKHDKRFSLFNVSRWGDAKTRPSCCSVVPQLYHGPFDTYMINDVLLVLQRLGSQAVSKYMDPEGIVIFHTAGNLMFKKTIKDDHEHKGNLVCRLPKSPRLQRVKVKGKDGRRNEQLPFEGPDRRKPNVSKVHDQAA